MNIEKIDLLQMHRCAKKAIDEMLKAAEQARHGLDEYFEQQLQHEIGCTFKQPRIFTYFNYPYNKGKEGKEPRADILVWGRDTKKREHFVWVEIKFTIWGRRNNPKWEEDFKKLRELPRRACHCGYWIWLNIFKQYEPQIRKQFGEGKNWKRAPKRLGEMAEFFGSFDKRRTLGQTLSQINRGCRRGAFCSIMPSLPLSESSSFSALLVTVRLK